MYFRMIYDDKLAQAAYLIGCQQTGEALIIDPERDIDRYLNLALSEGLRIVAATETHIHADFLSGARELAERTGVKLYLSDEGDADWKYEWLDQKQGGGSYDYQLLHDGDSFHVGLIEVVALHTPGHTPEHLCFTIQDRGGGASEPMGIASGDFVFVGDVGRPDLLETAAGVVGAKDISARVLYRSLQDFKSFPDYLQLWPGHGAGSACGKALGAVPQSTVGYEKRFNPAIATANDEEVFVKTILHGQPEPPLYFARMKRDNKGGPPVLGKMPRPDALTAGQIPEVMAKEGALLDTRSWQEFVAGHLPDALFTPLDKSFPTISGSYVTEEQDIYLIVDEARLEEAVADLIRIGLDRIVGFISPAEVTAYGQQGGSLAQVQYRGMSDILDLEKHRDMHILDVRRADEFEVGHLPGATNIAHTRLLARIDEVPQDKTLLVHCRSGIRSSYATALLQKHGFEAIQMDGGFLEWERVGGEVVRAEMPTLRG